ncbi:hypothetical protein ACXM1Q_002120 [Streptococcus sp. 10F2]
MSKKRVKLFIPRSTLSVGGNAERFENKVNEFLESPQVGEVRTYPIGEGIAVEYVDLKSARESFRKD